MDDDETEAIIAKIEVIQTKLDDLNAVGTDYIVPLIKELRNHVFQVHASYEMSMEIIIKACYLKESEPIWSFGVLLAQINFYGKTKLVKSSDPDFPLKTALEINNLRNTFAHTKRRTLCRTYSTAAKILEIYVILDKANQDLEDYWASNSLFAP